MNREEIRAKLADALPGGLPLLFEDGLQDEFWRRTAAADEYQQDVEDIRAEGARLLGGPLPELPYSLFSLFERQGSRLEYERVYFERRRRLNTMALLSLLEPDQGVYREALQDILWSICSEYTWCLPAHLKRSMETDGTQSFAVDSPDWSRRERKTTIDLFAAETGLALAEILTLTESWLPPLIRSRITEEIAGRIFKPYLQHGPYFWETAKHNWAAVCAGSIASAALHLLDDRDQLAAILEKALSSMDFFLAGFGDDGACQEGLGYWNYGFGFYVCFADLLKKRTKGGIDLLSGEKVRRIAEFQQKIYLENDLVVNFSDSQQHASVMFGLTHYLSSVYESVQVPPLRLRARYTEDHCSRWMPALRNLIWFDSARSGTEWGAADYFLSDAQWLISRHADTSGRRFGFAAKGGHNDEPHNHNDVGHLLLTGDGQAFLCDLGAGEYTAGYFGSERYSYDCNGSQGHSVPIIDGLCQAAGEHHAAGCLDASIGKDEDRFQFDLSKAYSLPNLSSLVRTFTWRKTDAPQLRLEDSFSFTSEPHSIVERFVTKLEPVQEEEAALALRSESGRKLVIRYDASVMSSRVSAHTYNDHFGKETAWYTIDLTVTQPGLRIDVAVSFQFL